MSSGIYITNDTEVPRVRRVDNSQYGAIPPGMRDAFERAAAQVEPTTMTEDRLFEEPDAATPLGYKMIPQDYTSVSPRQRSVHQLTEFLAVLGIPFFVWLTFNRKLPGWARLLAAVYGVGTVVVDAGLLATWAAHDEGKAGPWSGWRR